MRRRQQHPQQQQERRYNRMHQSTFIFIRGQPQIICRNGTLPPCPLSHHHSSIVVVSMATTTRTMPWSTKTSPTTTPWWWWWDWWWLGGECRHCTTTCLVLPLRLLRSRACGEEEGQSLSSCTWVASIEKSILAPFTLVTHPRCTGCCG